MKLRVIVLGAGYRGRAYAAYATAHPDQLEIVGVADPVQARTIPAAGYWDDWRACLAAHPEADVVMVTLPDALHYDAAIAALDGGYHLLLEKPIAATEEGSREIVRKANAVQRLVMVGHILRFTSYFAHIKALIDSGELGEIVSIVQQESVGFWKFAHSFVRGSLANSNSSSPIIISKCSHDFDLFVWWLAGRKCRKVSSFGSLGYFRRENQPEGAAERCVDCPSAIERKCIVSARRLYLEQSGLEYLFADSSTAAMERMIQTTNFGRCAFRCDNNVPDRQVVNMEFEGGATASLVMTGFTAENIRATRIALTRGEIIGDGDSLDIRRFDGSMVETGAPSRLKLPNKSRHGGGDFNLVAEMIRLLARNDVEELKAVTTQALESHIIGFAAERSRLSGGQVIEIQR